MSKNVNASEYGVTDEDIKAIRIMARMSGISPAEHLRNTMCSMGVEINAVTIDGVTATTPDFDQELAALIEQEGAL